MRDKTANLYFAGLTIPDVSGMDTRRVRYLLSNGKVVLGLVRREFRRELEVPAMVGSSDVSRFNRLGEFTVLVIPDVSGIRRPETNG